MTAWGTVAALPAARTFGCATAVGGYVYYLGGSAAVDLSVPVTTVYRYDPATDTWTTRAALPQAVTLAAAGYDPQGRVIIAGGYDSSITALTTVRRYDPGTDAWTTIAPLPSAVAEAAFCTDSQGRLYVIGGTTGAGNSLKVYRWNPSTSAWDTLAALTNARVNAGAAVDTQDRVYLVGGHQAGQANSQTAPALRYDPSTNAWTTIATPSSQHRNGPVVLSEANGRVYLISGVSNASGSAVTVTVAERFDPTAGTWTTITAIPSPRVYAGAARVGGGLYAIGGHPDVGSSAATSTVQRDSENTAPNTATATAPINNAQVDRTQAIPLQWAFTDPDAGDTQSRADVRYRVGTGAFTTITNAATTASTYSIPANTFTAGQQPGWQVLTYDALGLPAGAWSTEAFFTAVDPPPAPVITAPAVDATIAASTYQVAWSSSAQDAYQLRRLANNAGAPADPTVPANVYFDTGPVEDAAARSRIVAYETNNRVEHTQVRTRSGGLWSAWASARATVSFTPPATPTLVLTAVKTRAEFTGTDAIDVAITNPAPGGGQPTVVSHDVLVDDGTVEGLRRVATGLAPGVTWRHPTPVAGRDYQLGRIRVVAVAANGTTATASS